MCGIAGIVDLAGNRAIANGIVQRMAQAIIHRGPDEEGYFQRPGLVSGLAAAQYRRLGGWSAAGRQRRPKCVCGF